MTQLWQNDAVLPVTVLSYYGPETRLPDFIALAPGMKVRVSGTSKGKGYQGVVKRHGFHGGPKSHGQKNRLRAPGSIGSTAPQRVIKGRRMAGHMGAVRVTVRNLKVVAVDAAARTISVRGAVPGMRGSKVEIRQATVLSTKS